MRTYYAGAGGGCFAGQSTVKVYGADGGGAVLTPIKYLHRGDVVEVGVGGRGSVGSGISTARVVCVCKIARAPTKALCLLPGGLALTARHPIRVNGEWMLPKDHPNAMQVLTGEEGCVYNVVLSQGHTIVLNGVECITWGHSIALPPHCANPYFSAPVLHDLARLPGWEAPDGLVQVGGCVKDIATGLVVGLLGEAGEAEAVSAAVAQVMPRMHGRFTVMMEPMPARMAAMV
jgi:hypothetical protein